MSARTLRSGRLFASTRSANYASEQARSRCSASLAPCGEVGSVRRGMAQLFLEGELLIECDSGPLATSGRTGPLDRRQAPS